MPCTFHAGTSALPQMSLVRSGAWHLPKSPEDQGSLFWNPEAFWIPECGKDPDKQLLYYR
jgi:hypothetical protein